MKNGMTAAVVLLVVAACTASAGAQDKMAKPMMGKDKTYTGCIAAGDMAGTYTLTHVMSDMAMGKDAMKKDAMAKDAMAKPMAIASTSVDLSKHVGHKVSVTGPDHAMGMAKGDTMAKPMAAWTVTSIKMVAASCDM